MERLAEALRFQDEVRAAFSRKGSSAPLRGEADEIRRELELLGWLQTGEIGWALTEAGKKVAEQRPTNEPARFALMLCVSHEAQNKGIVSRLLARLWELSPEGQGAIVLLTPPIKDAPERRDALRAWLARTVPVWLEALQKRMSGFASPDAVDDIVQQVDRSIRDDWSTWPPSMRRRRLREVLSDRLFNMLFGHLCSPRDLHTWQSRIDWAGLTMTAQSIPGSLHRLWFPVGAFRSSVDPSFTPIEGLYHEGRMFHVHAPSGPSAEEHFAELLYKCYGARQQREGVEYVSLPAVRDHVCYLLRIGNNHFEMLLQQVFLKALGGKLPYAMALEVDVSPSDLRRLGGTLVVTIDHTPRYILSMRKRATPDGGAPL